MTAYRKRLKSLSLLAIATFVSCYLLYDEFRRINEAFLEIEGLALAAAVLQGAGQSGATLNPLEDSFTEGLPYQWKTPPGSILSSLLNHDESGGYRFDGSVLLPNGEPVRFTRNIEEDRDRHIADFTQKYFGDDLSLTKEIHYELLVLTSPENRSRQYTLLFANGKPVYGGYGNVNVSEGWTFVDEKAGAFKSPTALKFDINQIAGEWIGDSLSATEGYLALRRTQKQQKIKLPIIGTDLDYETGVFAGAIICAFISILLLHTALGLGFESTTDISEPWLLLPTSQSTILAKIIGSITTFIGFLSIVCILSLPAISSFLLYRVPTGKLGAVVSAGSSGISALAGILALWQIVKWRFGRFAKIDLPSSEPNDMSENNTPVV